MYFDPGFGSMIIQVIVAALAGLGAYFYMIRSKLSAWFHRKDNKDEAVEQAETAQEAAEQTAAASEAESEKDEK